jgi:cytochrome c2
MTQLNLYKEVLKSIFKMIKNIISKKRVVLSSLICMMTFVGTIGAADIDAGKTLFRNQCASCHNKDMKSDLVGPALGGIQERWAEYPQEDLYAWIRNSSAMINAGHPRATELWNEWKPNVMSNFLNLTDDEIASLLEYIQCTYDGSCGPQPLAVGPAGGAADQSAQESNNTLLFAVLALVLAFLAIILARVLSNLNYMVAINEGKTDVQRKSLVEILTSKGIIAFVIFALVVLGGYTTVNNAIMLGRQQGYEPTQPIAFSHATHAGLHKIECQYCHDGARRSKHSVIPAANTCMNCHKAIKVGSKYGTAELTKIYASIGFDPNTDTYLENYDEYSEDDIKRVYMNWIADTYIKETGTLDAKGEALIEDQWEGIKTSLTNETKDKIQGPIEWVRIHNLPDHAYFNHAQHVTVGKLECQTCHGPVEEMEVVAQYAPLSMGWCINCHRETEVQFTSNEYYQDYEKLHADLASGKKDKVTVEDIGGLECQKCHY